MSSTPFIQSRWTSNDELMLGFCGGTSAQHQADKQPQSHKDKQTQDPQSCRTTNINKVSSSFPFFLPWHFFSSCSCKLKAAQSRGINSFLNVEATLFHGRQTLLILCLPVSLMPPQMCVLQANFKVFFPPRLYVHYAVRAGACPGISCSQPLTSSLLIGQECGKLLQREALCKVWLKQVPDFTGGHIRVNETTS